MSDSSATGFSKHQESAIVSDSEGDAIDSELHMSANPPLLRRSSSLFSLSSKDDLPKPDSKEYLKFIDDNRHFSVIRNLHMADFITLLNGFSGFYSIISCLRYTLTGQTHYVQRAHFFILLGLFFDFFDGRVARLRNKSSLMGQELDSLADLVSFGVSPATIAFAIGFRTTVDVLFLAFWVLCGLTRLPIPTNLFWVGFMALLVYKDWIHDNLPFGIVFQDTLFEFHLVTIGFVLQGCAEISKSLKIPKP